MRGGGGFSGFPKFKLMKNDLDFDDIWSELIKLVSSTSMLAEHLGQSLGTLKPKRNIKLQSITNNTLNVKDIIGTCLNVAVIKDIISNQELYSLMLHFFSFWHICIMRNNF